MSVIFCDEHYVGRPRKVLFSSHVFITRVPHKLFVNAVMLREETKLVCSNERVGERCPFSSDKCFPTLVNGLQGIVIALEEDGPVVAFPTVTVKLKTVSFSLFDPVSNTVLAERRQVSLALGYALTGHKARGLTLDQVMVNCGNIYQPGQRDVCWPS